MSVILMYHRVAAPDSDPFGLAVSPDRFAAHVEHLLATTRTVPLSDLAGDRSRGQVAITFDDGYADNALVAAPLLAQAGIPATWFITTGALGRRRFWWDRLARSVLSPEPGRESLDVEIEGRQLWFDLRVPAARRTSLRFLHRRLRSLPPDFVEASVAEIVDLLGTPGRSEDGISMTADELRAMADLPLQEVGAHTRTHLQLRGQREALQRDEILGSVDDLAALLQRPVRSFAYPFGSPGAVGDLAPRLVAEAGCTLACSTDQGPVRRGSDRYRLPRLNVQNWDGDEFRARLDAALAAR